MTHDLIARREQVMDDAGRALDAAWPERKGDEYTLAMQTAARELESIASRMPLEGLNRTEQSRTYRYLGSVYSDLAPALGKEMLYKARESYEKAESLLAGEPDGAELAKLNFNFGNTLRQIDPNNVQLLAEARNRLLVAREYFVAHAPEYLSQADMALVSVENLLKIAPVAAVIKQKIKSARRTLEQLANETDAGIAFTVAPIEALIAGLSLDRSGAEKTVELQRQVGAAVAPAVSGGPLTDEEMQIWTSIRERLDSEVSAGVVSNDRAETLRQVLDSFGTIWTSGEEDLSSMMSKIGKIRDFIKGQFELSHYLSHGVERPPEGSRGARLVELNWHLRRYLLEEMGRPEKGSDEGNEAFELETLASKVDKRIYEAGADRERTLTVQSEAFLPLALAVRSFSARSYIMPAHPIWSSAKISQETNSVLYSGPQRFRPSIEAACRTIGLQLIPELTEENPALRRWESLQKAMAVVFDLRTSDPREKASVAYEMGIALTLGKPVTVLVAGDSSIPFDVDVHPVLLTGTPEDESILADAIDRSLVWTYPRPAADSLMNTVEFLLEKYERPNPNLNVDQTLRVLSNLREKADSLVVSRTVTKLFDYLNDGRTIPINPVWPPVYPSVQQCRLFHVMPFGPEWAPEVSKAARAACEVAGVWYVRGDEATESVIIRSIWEQLARATYVLVDLTGLNPNVALELGIAHTLGKKILVVAQGDPGNHLFQSISRLRVSGYDKDNPDETLAGKIKELIGSALTC